VYCSLSDEYNADFGWLYNWTVIPVEKVRDIMTALEKASVNEDIIEFTLFLASLINESFPD